MKDFNTQSFQFSRGRDVDLKTVIGYTYQKVSRVCDSGIARQIGRDKARRFSFQREVILGA